MDLSHPPTDRRRTGRTTEDRRAQRVRLEGVWTEAERARRVAQMRDEHHDRHAITISGQRVERLQPGTEKKTA